MKIVYVVWREEAHKSKREFCIAETPLAAIRALLATGAIHANTALYHQIEPGRIYFTTLEKLADKWGKSYEYVALEGLNNEAIWKLCAWSIEKKVMVEEE